MVERVYMPIWQVSHPNGTEALITKVVNMILTKDITLYDVLVVQEYCVSLMSIHKVARDSRLIVGFDESNYCNSSVFEKTKPFCNLTKDLWHSRLGHPSDQGNLQGSNGSASEDVMAATFDEHNSSFEDNDDNISSPIGAEQVHQPLRRSERLNKSYEPKPFWEASSNQHWVDAMNKEIDALYENNT
ncbi:hypothetical protein Tco_0577756 [Tanacetum coccineum]